MVIGYGTDTKLSTTAFSGPGLIESRDGSQRETLVTQLGLKARKSKSVSDRQLRAEIGALLAIAELAKGDEVALVYSYEVELELLFQPSVDVLPGRLYGAPLERIASPLLPDGARSAQDRDSEPKTFIHTPSADFAKYSQLLRNHPDKIDEILREALFRLPVGQFAYQLDFRYLLAQARNIVEPPNAASLVLPVLSRIEDARLSQIKHDLNVQDNANSLMDAYHLWTAELAECDYFLTTDGVVRNRYRGTLSVVSPLELIDDVSGD